MVVLGKLQFSEDKLLQSWQLLIALSDGAVSLPIKARFYVILTSQTAVIRAVIRWWTVQITLSANYLPCTCLISDRDTLKLLLSKRLRLLRGMYFFFEVKTCLWRHCDVIIELFHTFFKFTLVKMMNFLKKKLVVMQFCCHISIDYCSFYVKDTNLMRF